MSNVISSCLLGVAGGRRLRLLAGRLLVFGVVVCGCVCPSVAAAAVTHVYDRAASKAASEGVSGRAGHVRAMAGDAGHVWLAELQNGAGQQTRVNEFGVAGRHYEGQLVEEGGVHFLTEGVGVGHATGEEQVYVGAGFGGEDVVAVYGPARTLEDVWTGAHVAGGSFADVAGEKRGVMNGVAVSNAFETAGDVYVATRELTPGGFGLNRVVVLKGEPHGVEGAEVGQITGTCKEPGVCAGGEVVPFREPLGVAVSAFNGDVLVADGPGPGRAGGYVVDVFAPETGVPGAYSFLFTVSATESGGPFQELGRGSLAVDGANGEFYVADLHANIVYEFDASGKLLGRLVGSPTGPGGALSPFKALESVGVEPVSGDVFIADYDEERKVGVIDVFGPDVVIPDVAVVEPPESVTPHMVVLRGTVNPDNAGEATCAFEYGTSTEYGLRAPCTAPVPNGEGLVSVKSGEAAVEPDTLYQYRLDATNANGTNTGECPADCGSFMTPGPGVRDEAATDVSAGSATLHATVDPHGKPTSYYFQYSLTSTTGCEAHASACTEIPAPPGTPLGAGGPVTVTRHVEGLAPGQEYHYRAVAVSELTAGKPEAFPGKDQTFTTQPAGAPLQIADERHWELVSPPDKHGAVLEPITASDVVQAAAAGNAITYAATLPTESGAQGFSELEQLLSRRGGSGWASEDIGLPHASAVGSTVGVGDEYRLFNEDLSLAAVHPFDEFTSLAPCVTAPESERTPYIRHNNVPCGGTFGVYDPLLSAADVPVGTKFGGEGNAGVQGASPDLSHVVLSSHVALAPPPTAGETTALGLYEWSAGGGAGAVSLVSVLPDGHLYPGVAAFGSEEGMMARGAVSVDGSRVLWSESQESKNSANHLYLRDLAVGHTVQLDVPEAACVASEECGNGQVAPVLQLATADDSRVLFTDTQRLTADAGEVPGQADLYECRVVVEAGVPRCVLSDVTPVVAGSGASAEVQGAVLGASSDASQLYFVGNGAIAEGAVKGDCHENTPPPEARCNLYVVHRGAAGWEEPRLVAVLGGEDWPTWKGGPTSGLDSLTARVSDDGRFVVFMSDHSLTGYDSRDAVTGRPDEEVFVYDASTGRLGCVSCDPTGARPVGVEYRKLEGGLAGLESGGFWAKAQGVAASVPGWTSLSLAVSRYQPRFLLDSGRVFFDSSDALVPQDVNGGLDVYEWEPVGVGSCTSVSGGFSGATGGCVGLVSSGAAAGESGFMDASVSGGDVFFLTGARLVGGDVDTALDLYDAHVCSVLAPCFSEEARPPACVTADSCRGPVSGQPEVFGVPASSTFAGEGNLSPVPGRPGLTSRQKLAKALKACRRLRARRRRLVCERVARRRYPVVRARKGGRG